MGSAGSGSSQINIPSEFKPLATGASQQGLGVQGQIPLTSFTGFNPRNISDMGNLTKWGLEDVASLRAVQPGILASMASLARLPEITSRPVEDPNAQRGQYHLLDQIAGGPVGLSPATQQGMQAWEQYVKPTVENEAVQMGLGRSGPGLEAIAQSKTMAYAPLVKDEI